MNVTECICHEISFRQLLEIRDQIDPDHGLCDLDALGALRSKTGCSSSCATCRPYILVALRTGEPAVPVMNGKQARQVERDALAQARSSR